MNELDAQLLAAHESGDLSALVALYAQAAAQAETCDAAGFYLTHAYVYALELGAPQAVNLRDELIRMGCETPT